MTAPLALLAAQSWRQAFFTTYALSLSFFEAVILDSLVRSNSKEASILSDVMGVRAALSEKGAFRAGREYQVEPISVQNGVFHPKLTVLTDDTSAHLLVGSGNLTFGGWGANLEILEHLHSSFAPDALEDAASFFELVRTSTRLRHSAGEQLDRLATELRSATRGIARDGNIRLLNSLRGPIAEQIAAFADDLGGAERLVAVAPFWEAGGADYLCRSLGLDRILIHAHPSGTIRGTFGKNWPWGAKSKTEAVCVELFDAKDKRRLHAKMFEVVCKRGRLLVSGSANATFSALAASRNIEASVIRIERQRSRGWLYAKAMAPVEVAHGEQEPENPDQDIGVLRAELNDVNVSGQVLTPSLTGRAEAFQVGVLGPVSLGQIALDPNSNFSFSARALERESWGESLLLLRIVAANGRSAEGFVSFNEFARMKRNMGAMAPRVMSLFRRMETPADVSAIISWFHANPDKLLNRLSGPSRRATDDASDSNAGDRTIMVADLRAAFDEVDSNDVPQAHHEAGWRRVIERIFAAFREPRGPMRPAIEQSAADDDDEDDEHSSNAAVKSAEDAQAGIESAVDVFEQLLALMLSHDNAARLALSAFDIAEYVARRLEPLELKRRSWLRDLVRALLEAEIPDDRKNDVAGAILALHLMEGRADEPLTRQRIQRLGLSFDGAPPSIVHIAGFVPATKKLDDFEVLWLTLGKIRTLLEQVLAYVKALEERTPMPSSYPDLQLIAGKKWPLLEAAITEDDAREDVIVLARVERGVCPKHSNTPLPTAEYERLKAYGIGIALYCCGSVILCAGGSA